MQWRKPRYVADNSLSKILITSSQKIICQQKSFLLQLLVVRSVLALNWNWYWNTNVCITYRQRHYCKENTCECYQRKILSPEAKKKKIKHQAREISKRRLHCFCSEKHTIARRKWKSNHTSLRRATDSALFIEDSRNRNLLSRMNSRLSSNVQQGPAAWRGRSLDC